MNTSYAAIWFSILVNIALASILATHFRRYVKSDPTSETKAKTKYSWLCLSVGIFSGFVVYLGSIALFNLPVGHGEVLIAVPLLNLLLACFLIVAGRMLIGWKPIKW